MPEYYVGTLSGTSADGIDVVLVDFAGDTPRLVAANTRPLPGQVRSEIRALSTPTDDEIERLGRLDVTLGRLIADAVNALLIEAGVANREVTAIGSHGQTLRHRPQADPPFTLQVGDPNTLAARTGIPVVGDFRRMDVARGGQGAPLVPAFHAALFRDPRVDRVVVNLGGIANLTVLPANVSRPVTGFDAGPANGLMDEWIARHRGSPFDADGAWAGEGRVLPDLLDAFLSDPYFGLAPPKSTGREQFHLAWVEDHLDGRDANPTDVQATLLELTAVSVARAVVNAMPDGGEVYACGGGVHNGRLMGRLATLLAPSPLATTAELGLDPDWVEGCAFAWLARQRVMAQPGALPEVTGATQTSVLGGTYDPGSGRTR